MTPIFTADSADDLMHESLSAVLDRGERIEPSKGPALELQSVVLELTDPIARLSRSEHRGRLFSALGELCWYLSGSNATDHIAYYIGGYAKYDEGGIIHGAYGPRLFSFEGIDQVSNTIGRLREEPSSRRAVIQLFDRRDVATPHEDVPCTCTMQFLVRGGSLHLITHMRSNDAYVGLPHDLFAFTMLQELVARSLDLPLGRYVHMVGSFHVYESHIERARAYLREGWQSNQTMPAMPAGDPWPSVDWLVKTEADLRTGVVDPLNVASGGEPYWSDLAVLLAIFTLWKSKRYADIATIRARLSTDAFNTHVDDKLGA